MDRIRTVFVSDRKNTLFLVLKHISLTLNLMLDDFLVF